MANLKSVAAAAGVSVATASRVLSGSDYPVAEDLRQRVQAAASELDYVPNAHARSLLNGSAGAVGVLVGNISDPYFANIVEGVHSAAAAHGLPVTICTTYRDPGTELEYFRMLQAQRCQLVIVAGSGLADDDYTAQMQTRADSLQREGHRLVTLGRHQLRGVDNVRSDNRRAGELVGGHLRELGHRRVGVLLGDLRVTSTRDRLEGLRSSGLGLEITEVRDATRDGGLAATDALLDDHPDLTAVVGTADQMALGALVAARRRGLSVPDDLSVVGGNDIDITRDVTPSLTTVHQPLREMGVEAVNIGLKARLSRARSVRMPVHLVARNSSGVAPDT